MKGLMDAGSAGFAAHLPPGHIHAFRDLMMPALMRVGAVTERTCESTRTPTYRCGTMSECSSRWRTVPPASSRFQTDPK